jgi:hypothetical protein
MRTRTRMMTKTRTVMRIRHREINRLQTPDNNDGEGSRDAEKGRDKSGNRSDKSKRLGYEIWM